MVGSSIKHKTPSETKNDGVIPKKQKPEPTHASILRTSPIISVNDNNVERSRELQFHNPNCTVTTGEFNSRPTFTECSEIVDLQHMKNEATVKPAVNGHDSIDNKIPVYQVTRCKATTSGIDNDMIGDQHTIDLVNEEFKNNDCVDLTFSDKDVKICVNTLYNENPLDLSTNIVVSDFKNETIIFDKFHSQFLETPAYFSDLVKIFPTDGKNTLIKLCAGCQDLNVAIDKVLLFHETKNSHVAHESIEVGLHPMNSTESVNSGLSYQKQLIALKEIFVDADPTYLENVLTNELHCDQSKMDAFVIEALHGKNIPTIKEAQDKIKFEEQCALYTRNFTVEGYLKEFPDPLYYFTKINDGSAYKNIAFQYLKERFCKISVKCIMQVLKQNKNNLTISCLKLAEYPPNLCGKRSSSCNLVLIHSLESLKEVCFNEHYEEITNYLKRIHDEKHNAFMKAKQCGNLLECNCCYNDEVIFEEIATCPEGHIFCKDCVRKGVETKMGDGVNKFTCLAECNYEFSLETLEGVLSPQLFSKIMMQKQCEEIKAANIPDIEDCPFCEYLGIPVAESSVFICMNPLCSKESCRKCNAESHIPFRCEEVEQKDEIKLRTYIEDKMTEALIRQCYKCKKEFIKENGCNKITCTCGALQCYICRQPIKDYTHFNPEGGCKFNLCPLYSTDQALHVDAVIDVAKTVKKAFQSDIKLKHDPTKILPSLKCKSRRNKYSSSKHSLAKVEVVRKHKN